MLVAFNGYFWDQPRTGSGQYLRNLVAGVGNVDFDVLIPPNKSPTPFDKLRWESWGVMSEARRKRARLLHVPYLSAPFVKKIPVIVTAHDMIPWVVPGYSGSAVVRLYLALMAASVKRARLIIADSDASRRDVIKVLKVPPSKVHTVYLGANPHPDYTQEQLAEVRARHHLPEHFAFYLGGFDLRKNVPLLLRAWRGTLDALCAESPKSKVQSPKPSSSDAGLPVLAIGGEVPAPGGVFRGEAARLRLLDGDVGPVRLLGRISEEDKPLLMAAAHLFVYPSAYEGFGLDPLEAMSVGCPVVSSSGGSLVEVVGDAGLLVPPNDERALRDAVIRAWTDDALRSQLSQLGRERAAQFTWQRTAEQTVELYHKALQGAQS